MVFLWDWGFSKLSNLRSSNLKLGDAFVSGLTCICLLRLRHLLLQLLLTLWAIVNRSSRCQLLKFIFSNLVHEEFMHRIKFLLNCYCYSNGLPQWSETADRTTEENLKTSEESLRFWYLHRNPAAHCARTATVLLPALAVPPPPTRLAMHYDKCIAVRQSSSLDKKRRRGHVRLDLKALLKHPLLQFVFGNQYEFLCPFPCVISKIWE